MNTMTLFNAYMKTLKICLDVDKEVDFKRATRAFKQVEKFNIALLSRIEAGDDARKKLEKSTIHLDDKQRAELHAEFAGALDEAIKERNKARKALAEVEWVQGAWNGEYYCPWCNSTKPKGHRPFCMRQRALKY